MSLPSGANCLGLMAGELQERLLLVGALVLMSALTVVWAFYFGHRRRHSHYHLRRHAIPAPPADSTEPRRRRRRRRHRPRNPTLAETRGLPPLRTSPPPDAAG